MLYDVVCDECGTTTCFACGLGSHQPSTCYHTEKWIAKNNAESENMAWLVANTKQCPACQKHIEKNQGCNHMTCRREVGGCGHEFCWICMGDWSTHGSATGGYYQCNVYEEKKKNNSKFAAEEAGRENAKNELARYSWHFTRFNNHERAAKFGVRDLPKIQNSMEVLHSAMGYPPSELVFLENGLKAVIKCREILKWTYAYGYYKKEEMEEHKVALFNQWQADLEKYCDHLHGMCEKDLAEFCDEENNDRSPFYHFRGDLVHYTEHTLHFCDNLISGLKEWEVEA